LGDLGSNISIDAELLDAHSKTRVLELIQAVVNEENAWQQDDDEKGGA
jgi:hypothetical protein